MKEPLTSSESCPLCGGSGWKTIPATSAKAQSVVRCDCRSGNWTDRLLKKARIPARYEHCTLSNFDSDFPGANRTLPSALFQANRFVEEYPLETTGLMLLGPIALNIVFFHVFMGRGSLLFAVPLALVESLAIWSCSRYFRSKLTWQSDGHV